MGSCLCLPCRCLVKWLEVRCVCPMCNKPIAGPPEQHHSIGTLLDELVWSLSRRGRKTSGRPHPPVWPTGEGNTSLPLKSTNIMITIWGNLVTTRRKTLKRCSCLATTSVNATQHLQMSERLSSAAHSLLHHSSFKFPRYFPPLLLPSVRLTAPPGGEADFSMRRMKAVGERRRGSCMSRLAQAWNDAHISWSTSRQTLQMRGLGHI